MLSPIELSAQLDQLEAIKARDDATELHAALVALYPDLLSAARQYVGLHGGGSADNTGILTATEAPTPEEQP